MSRDLKNSNRELLEDFIRVYQSQPCLWRVKSKEYHDRARREAAYEMLLEKYRLIDANADKEAVVKKINSFRTNHRREKKKVEESLRSGRGTDEIYKPSLWYYHLFDFLGDQETPRSSVSNLTETENDNVETATEVTVEDSEESTEQEYESAQSPTDDTSSSTLADARPIESTPKTKPPARPSKRANCDSILGTIEEHFKKPKPPENRYDVFGNNVALRMKDISNKTQRLLVEKIINDALFMGELGQLTLSHTIRDSVTSTSYASCPTAPQLNYNSSHFSQTPSYYEPVSPQTVNSGTSNQSTPSIASYVSTFIDT